MVEVGVFEAKNRLSELIDRAEKGEEFVITRRGRRVAKLSPFPSDFDRAEAMAAARRIRERAKAAKLGPFNWDEVKKDRDLGRR